MSNSHDRRRLDQLRSDLHRVLEPVLQGSGFALPRRGPGRDANGARQRAAGAAGDLRGVRGSQGVRAPVPGDERRIRALAKEIKRLITEDSRRGIGV